MYTLILTKKKVNGIFVNIHKSEDIILEDISKQKKLLYSLYKRLKQSANADSAHRIKVKNACRLDRRFH